MDINFLDWRFSDKCYADNLSFEQALRANNNQISDEDWNPSAVAAPYDKLLLAYMCFVSSRRDLLDNEFLSDSDKNIFEQHPDEENYQVDLYAEVAADNGKHFTVVELLRKAHNQHANKHLGDHVHFEEIGEESGRVNDLPVYYFSAGS